MTKIEAGQLVRIVKFHRMEAMRHGRPSLIGQTGRFIACYPSPFDKKAYRGFFFFEPDELDQNRLGKSGPSFIAVYVEPVEEKENEKSETAD